ncbi:MAG TPA: bifunctional adenosylcobinamide kinase/adenosylcobinamide-phosphate guanylyltransferase, partial [Herpetosiphonaceae bacterium]|nr:bifunctional adenosylcobinamide kinase/adenosylcobinamide-phosphate guanylyltransferase [Herpetosiphonaceae bacterium]
MSTIVLFTGGARSGKSRRAEEYAARCGRPVTYVATGAAGDAEMAERIRRHREQRPADWPTVEAPHAVAAALRELAPGGVALLDCLSLLVSNLLLAVEGDPQPAVEAEVAALLAAAAERDLTLIVVTNEVGMGVVPEYALGRAYRDLLGRAAQRIAAAADEVYLVVAGIQVELRALAGGPTADSRPPASDSRSPAHGSIDYVELSTAGIAPAEVLDFSSNLNPAGTPPAVRALLDGYDPAPYPDRHCLALRGAITERHGCRLAQVLAGNGSNELIHLIARALLGRGDAALVIGPTFGEYAHASRLAG